MGELNPNQQRHLVVTFRHVDDVLSRALHVLERSDSPLSTYISDGSPALRRTLAGQLEALRARMLDVLEKEHIALPAADISARWGFQTALLTARTEFEEMRSRYLRGFGEVDGEAGRRVDRIVDELLAQIDGMERALGGG